MVGFRLYSDRLEDAANAGQADVYQYESVPQKARVQIRQIIRKAMGNDSYYNGHISHPNQLAVGVKEVVCHEKGLDNFGYSPKVVDDYIKAIENAPTDDFIDILEVSCILISDWIPRQFNYREKWAASLDPKEAIEQINFRLRDAGVGFQYENGKIFRVDSQYLHAEAVKPALSLLNAKGFEGPQAEFLSAHGHFRAGRNKEAITEAAKAFESTMKAVCDLKGWDYQSGARASDLLKVLRVKKLWPDYLDASFDQLIATLGSGLPKVRNEDGAHGQGSVPKSVPDYIAAYALHLAASKIVLITQAANAE